MTQEIDCRHMRHALALADAGLGRVAPNPSVGCVLVKNGRVISCARTADGGRPHAEYEAIRKAGSESEGATAYVTFEPCAHEGNTPSCARLLIDAEVARVVVACQDPDPRTSGKGIDLLKGAGLDVRTGVLEQEALSLNQGFILKILEKRPFVTLKTATSLDGKTALYNGQSQWITSEGARKHVHRMRARHDAILTGIGTVLKDNPTLTARVPGLKHTGPRIVLDSQLRFFGSGVAENLKKTASSSAPVFVFYDPAKLSESFAQEEKIEGVRIFPVNTEDLKTVLKTLAKEGVTRLFIEAGQRVFDSFLKAELYDRIFWYRAPILMGGEAKGIAHTLKIEGMERVYHLKRLQTRVFGRDMLEIYEKQPYSPSLKG